MVDPQFGGLEGAIRRWRNVANQTIATLKGRRYAIGPAEQRRRKAQLARTRAARSLARQRRARLRAVQPPPEAK